MMMKQRLDQLKSELMLNLEENILPYWLRLEDPEGGYYGRVDWQENVHPDDERGCILNARILWTLSAAARLTGNQEYAQAATRQMRYFCGNFIDREYGGCFWSINADSTPRDTKKQFYAIAFAIYALSEYYALSGNQEALDEALALFKSIEEHSRDHNGQGYFEASTRDWQPITDMRLSDKDMNSEKTMNTLLHILEGYTNLLRVCRRDDVLEATSTLLRLFNNVVIDRSNDHLGLFFDSDMKRVEHGISYGHDIEASWLMLEAAQVIGDEALLAETKEATHRLAVAALEGLQPDGSMIYELHGSGLLDTDRHWWVQAETVVGLIYLARFHGDESAYAKAEKTWEYIKAHLADHVHGEWWWRRSGAQADLISGADIERFKDDKAGFWKCPYHNSRMCMEVVKIINENQD